MPPKVIQEIYALRADLRFLRRCNVKPEMDELQRHLIQSLEDECVALLQSEAVRRIAVHHRNRRAEQRKAA